MNVKYINRTLEKTVNKFIGKYPVIMITGPRQVGKTTLLNYLSMKSEEKINYVSLDDMLVRNLANEDPELFLRTYETPLVIDEFQYAPNLLSYIKMNVDARRKNEMFGDGEKTNTLYYLTGSQIFQTMKYVSDSLAGRIGIFDMFALSTREINNSVDESFIPKIDLLRKKVKLKNLSTNKIYERILKGSYPEIYSDKEIPIENYYSTYIRTYIERDIRTIINVKDENKFVNFLASLAARTGAEYNGNSIANEIGVTNKTVDEWISILKNTGIIYLLGTYSNNKVSNAIKKPKIYFMDTGLACYLTGYTDATILEKSAYSGAIFETYIISEIIKSYTNNGLDPRKHLYFYRDSSQKEIDLLVIDNNVVYPVEIKKSANPHRDAIKNFSVVDKFELPVGNGIVLCLAKDIIAIDSNNFIVPIEYI